MGITKLVLITTGSVLGTTAALAAGYFKGKSDGMREAMNGELANAVLGKRRQDGHGGARTEQRHSAA